MWIIFKNIYRNSHSNERGSYSRRKQPPFIRSDEGLTLAKRQLWNSTHHRKWIVVNNFLKIFIETHTQTRGSYSGRKKPPFIRSDEGLTLAKRQLWNSLRWPTYVINSVDNTKIPCYTLPPTQQHRFFKNLPLLFTPDKIRPPEVTNQLR